MAQVKIFRLQGHRAVNRDFSRLVVVTSQENARYFQSHLLEIGNDGETHWTVGQIESTAVDAMLDQIASSPPRSTPSKQPFRDEVLGVVRPSKHDNSWLATTSLGQEIVSLSFSLPTGINDPRESIARLKAVIVELSQIDQMARSFAANQLLGVLNTEWRDHDDPHWGIDDFTSHIKLEALSTFVDGTFELNYGTTGIFEDHTIFVSLDHVGLPTEASL